MTEKTLRLLRAQFTEELARKLVAYSRFLVGIHYWRGQRGGEILPRGESPETIVSLVLHKLIEGQIHWDTDRVDLERFLKLSVRREIGHYSLLSENRVSATSLDTSDLAADPYWPSDSDESSQWVEEFVSSLRERDEPMLVNIVQCLLTGTESARLIADKLGVCSEDVYNARKVLQRRLGEFLGRKAKRKTERDSHE